MRFLFLFLLYLYACSNNKHKTASSVTTLPVFEKKETAGEDKFITYIADPQKQNIQFYYKDSSWQHFKSILNLKTWLEKNHQTLVFAMNAGMYKEDNSPLGLFIQHTKRMAPLNKKKGTGNFYLQPNGVFYLTTNNAAVVCTTKDFANKGNVKFATQSGPMLVINGAIHPVFTKGSANVNIRNGVGILPGNKIVFAMSKKEINFYDFANYFQSLGCNNALYLDGFVSRTYLPQQNWIQTDGNFGVIIGIAEEKL
jgi:uncharacterized protein YigE (DUF2233 family)